MDHHFSSSLVSTWQSAVSKIARRPVLQDGMPVRAPVDLNEERIKAATEAAHNFYEERAATGEDRVSLESDLQKGAAAALKFAEALINGAEDKIAAARDEFKPYGERDPKWAECITEFLEHYSMRSNSDVPYVKYTNMADCVLPSTVLPSRCTIGIIGDWGTGDARAQALLSDLATFRPDILIHMGDIYYSCTSAEAFAFEKNCRASLPNARIFTLCGNHDMYSGGAPYYGLLKKIGQPASFFCLRNRDWQLIAGDTGYKDFNPFKFGGIASHIRDRDEGENYSELDWHKDKLVNAGGRRTILFTHHQPFTRNSAIEGKSSINPKLLGQFADFLPEIPLWFWGHEHNQVIYEEFQGVQRGRCVGASAIPVPSHENLDQVSPKLANVSPDLIPATVKQRVLRPEQRSHLFELGYALIRLDGKAAAAEYYAFDTSTGRRDMRHSESIPLQA